MPTGRTRAETAVRAGDDALAKEALRRKGEKEAEQAETQKALQEQGVYADQLTAGAQGAGRAAQGREAAPGDAARPRRGPSATGIRCRARPPRSTTSTGCRAIDAVEAEASLDDELGGRRADSADAERKLNELAEKSTRRRRAGRAEEEARGRWREIASLSPMAERLTASAPGSIAAHRPAHGRDQPRPFPDRTDAAHLARAAQLVLGCDWFPDGPRRRVFDPVLRREVAGRRFPRERRRTQRAGVGGDAASTDGPAPGNRKSSSWRPGRHRCRPPCGSSRGRSRWPACRHWAPVPRPRSRGPATRRRPRDSDAETEETPKRKAPAHVRAAAAPESDDSSDEQDER